MKEINYLEIIKKAWKITWKNKYLWWFGLFLALGGGASFNLLGNNSEWNNKIEENGNHFENFISQHWQLVSAIIIVAVIIGLTLFVLGLISKAGLIKTLDKIEKNIAGNFKNGFKEGRKYFWKLLLIGLILGFLILSVLIILGVPVALLVSLKSPIMAISAAFLAILIFVPLVILVVFIGKYSVFYVVLSDLGIKASLENGYQIFKKNILPSIIMALLFIPINIALVAMVISALLVIGIVFSLIGIILYLILAKIGIIIVVALGCFVFVIFLILINSVFQVFSQTVYFLFFKEIASVKEEEKAEETEVEIAQKNIPTPEEA